MALTGLALRSAVGQRDVGAARHQLVGDDKADTASAGE
jgi:hypothetical protein